MPVLTNVTGAPAPLPFSRLRCFLAALCRAALLAVLLAGPARAQLVTYPAPAGISLTADYAVRVSQGGTTASLPVYDLMGESVEYNWEKTAQPVVAYFDFSGPVHVTVEVKPAFASVSQVAVRPLSAGVSFTRSGNTISFSLSSPANLSIEVNGRVQRPLFLFANPLESNPLNCAANPDAGVKCFGPGVHELPNGVGIESGQTLYLAGGAVLKSNLDINYKQNIRIRGRGILLNLNPQRMAGWVQGSTGVELEGIIIIGTTPQWTVQIYNNENTTVSNLKVLGRQRDGLNINGCKNTVVRRSFLFSHDDAMSPKSYNIAGFGARPVDNLTVTNTTFFNYAGGCGIRFGGEMEGDYWQDITFRDCDIIHSLPITNPSLGLQEDSPINIPVDGRSKVRRVRFENITVEDNRDPYIIRLGIYQAAGGLDGVSFTNLRITSKTPLPPSDFRGYSEASRITGVLFSGLVINGTAITSRAQAQSQANFNFAPFADVSFAEEAVSSGTYVLRARHSGKVLHALSAADGTDVQQYTASGSPNQQWVITSVPEGYHKIESKLSYRSLDINGGASALANGAKLIVYGYYGGYNQQWKLEATTDGYYRILARHSGKALDVDGGPAATGDGIKVQQWEYVGGLNQQWKLEKLSSALRTGAGEVAAAREDAPAPAVRVHPNPAAGKVVVGWQAQSAQPAEVSIADVFAKTRISRQAPSREGDNRLEINTGTLESGVYVVRVRTGGRTTTHKLVIAR